MALQFLGHMVVMLECIQEGVKYTRTCLTNSSCDLFIFSRSNKEFDEPAGNQAGFQQASGEPVSIKWADVCQGSVSFCL